MSKFTKSIKVCCAFCKSEIFRSQDQIDTWRIFFCTRSCKHKAQKAEAGISLCARSYSDKEEPKLRPCLGWCGKKILTPKTKRFCDTCGNRSRYASTGMDANIASSAPSHD
jgi:hypothetical protein